MRERCPTRDVIGTEWTQPRGVVRAFRCPACGTWWLRSGTISTETIMAPTCDGWRERAERAEGLLRELYESGELDAAAEPRVEEVLGERTP